MTIQLNTDKNLTIHQEYEGKINGMITDAIGRFGDLVNRIDVHLSDENGSKDGLDDKRCVLEAKITGKEPIAVTNTGDNYDLAIAGALNKLKSKLETVAGKLKAY